MELRIIDISSWQHPGGAGIDWHAVAEAGYHGVISKATQGNWYANPFFAGDIEGAHRAGLMAGAYHFAEPGRTDAPTQAAYFHQHVAGLELELGLWLDLEEMGGLLIHDLQAWAEQWLTDLDTPQVKAGVYMNLDYTNQLAQLAQTHRLWLANPSNIGNAFQPVIIQTGQAPVPGVEGSTDVDTVPNARSFNPPGGGGQPVPPPHVPPQPPPSRPDQPVLNQGASGEAVTHLQALLNARGAGLATDGVFGPATHEAVIGFQAANGLTVDGIVGPQTWTALGEAASRPVEAEPGHEPTVQQGSTGGAVVLLQRLLGEVGHPMTVDGDFGPITRSAVVAFQLSKNLAADGIVGPITWGALRSAT